MAELAHARRLKIWTTCAVGVISQCPLLALSGHRMALNQCPLLGAKRTLLQRAPTSAFDPKRTSGLSSLWRYRQVQELF